MALSAATLKSELQTRVTNVNLESLSITAWAQAFHVYFTNAVGAGVPIVLAALPAASPPRTAMSLAMAGLNSPNLGSTRIAAGVTAYWATILAGPGTYFPTAAAITVPTALSGLKVALDGVFLNNTQPHSPALTTDAMFTAIAGVIHTACTGGTILLPGPVTGAIT